MKDGEGLRFQEDRKERACCFSPGTVLLLSLTRGCNQRCVHCFRTAEPMRVSAINLGILLPRLRVALVRYHIQRVVISGGEPTLVPNLLDLIAGVAAFGVSVGMCTNATRISPSMADALAAAHLARATVGIEGIGSEYDWFRGMPGGFARALSGARAMVGAGISVTANVTLWNGVLNAGREIGYALSGLDLASISVTAPLVRGRLNLHRDQVDRVGLSEVRAFADHMRSTVRCPVELRVPLCQANTCPSGRTVFAMDSEGRVSGCPEGGALNVVELVNDVTSASCPS
jgi:MoaA/NifB/PqqE/SkfB family radical SAM enzyme